MKDLTNRLNRIAEVQPTTQVNEFKRRKLTRVSDLPSYYRFNRATVNGYRGYMYHLSDVLDSVTKEVYKERYNNLVFMGGSKAYAPELKHSIIFVADKVIH